MDFHLAGFDRQLLRTGITHLCGVDEAGRGPLAGPVVAAAVILKENTEIPGIDDSKRLTEVVRETLEPQIKQSALVYGIGTVDEKEIERINILQATFKAMRLAVDDLMQTPDYILVDGRDFPVFYQKDSMQPISGRAVIKGDRQSQCIAAASILAKVHRDRLMREYDKAYPQYGFARHKGYATKAHCSNILKYGPCEIHRKSFLKRIYYSNQETINYRGI
ncbi:MAG: ribonuclease HII [Calditrichaceae bacterium]